MSDLRKRDRFGKLLKWRDKWSVEARQLDKKKKFYDFLFLLVGDFGVSPLPLSEFEATEMLSKLSSSND